MRREKSQREVGNGVSLCVPVHNLQTNIQQLVQGSVYLQITYLYGVNFTSSTLNVTNSTRQETLPKVNEPLGNHRGRTFISLSAFFPHRAEWSNSKFYFFQNYNLWSKWRGWLGLIFLHWQERLLYYQHVTRSEWHPWHDKQLEVTLKFLLRVKKKRKSPM